MTDERPSSTPNKKIDLALKRLMRGLDKKPPEIAVKILAAAIAWEKVKAKVSEDTGDFNPENL